MLKRVWPFVALILVAIGIHYATYSPPVRMVLACDKKENCVDLFGNPSIGIRMGADHMWGIGRADDPSGHCRNGCTIKTIYDQVGHYDVTQTDPGERPAYCHGAICFNPKSDH